MTSIFELAQFLADRDAAKGNFEPAQIYLDRAARQAVAGWTTLEEAEDDPGTRYDAWGNEIQPGVIYDAVRYLRHAPADNERLRAALTSFIETWDALPDECRRAANGATNFGRLITTLRAALLGKEAAC